MIHAIQHLFHLQLIIFSDASLNMHHYFLHESATYVHFLRAFSAWCIDALASQPLKDLGDTVILFGRGQAFVPVLLLKMKGEATHADVTSEP